MGKTMDSVISEKTLSDKLSTRYNENLAFFQQHMPVIYNQLIANTETPQLTIDSQSGQIHRMRDGQSLYPQGPVQYAIDEVKIFLEKQQRFIYTPAAKNIRLTHLLQKKAFHKCNHLYETLHQEQKRIEPAYMDVMVFGVGLGYHIEMLANKKKFKHITIIEKDLCNFKASMYAVKWENILRNLDDHHTITFLLNDKTNPEQDFINEIKNHCYMLYPAITMCTILYNHYSEMGEYNDIKKVIGEFSTHLKVVYERIAPEAQRLFNANENSKRNYPILNLKKTRLEGENLRVAIIGAGPSLDIYGEILKQHRDKFFLVSAGSSLSSLLRMGIKPDVHYELEFQKLATNLLEHVHSQFDLSTLDLICTYEAHPGYPGLFKNAYMNVPETSEIATLFGSDYVLRKGGITCTNGATALFSRLSDADIYLFGVDFANTGGQHHNKTNISQDDNLPENLQRVHGSQLPTENIRVNSTRGEVLTTRASLNSARMAMNQLISVCKNNFYNCSHGAAIEGTTYISTEELAEKLADAGACKATLVKETNLLSNYPVVESSIYLLRTSIVESKNIHKIISSIKKASREQVLFMIDDIYQKIIQEYHKKPGHFRNIMSFNRMPILLLFIMINYSEESDCAAILKSWSKDYISFINYCDRFLVERMKQHDFFVTEDWNDYS